MCNETLKAFYYGNLTPADRKMIRDSKAARTAAELAEAENRLAQSLSPELQPTLERFVKAQQELDSIMVEASYIDGFKTGARFMMEILDDTWENLKPVAE